MAFNCKFSVFLFVDIKSSVHLFKQLARKRLHYDTIFQMNDDTHAVFKHSEISFFSFASQ